MKIKANAKINLFLDVLGKRKDGYHNIKTVFQEVSLSDDITIRETKKNGIKITCNKKNVPTGSKNLCYIAAQFIKNISGTKKGVEITIKKNIPVGGGLGGGSSDAAAVLKALNKLWNLKLGIKQLAGLGKTIGADVPFFLFGGRCLGVGIGDKLTPLKIKKTQWYVIVKPPFEISTKAAYLRLTKINKIGRIKSLKARLAINAFYNRLEDAVIPLYHEIKKIKEELLDSGAKDSLMSGSGSCVFGTAENKSAGEKIKKHLKKDGYMVWLVHSVKSHL